MPGQTKQPPQSGDSGIVGQLTNVLTLPLVMAQQMLPKRELPVYLGVGALATIGALDWPAAVAVGLGYAALRRWGPGRATS